MNTITGEIRKLTLNLPQVFFGDWWVEISTSNPNCVYYFGPFTKFEEASETAPSYIQDLIDEGAQNISTTIKRCRPTELTQCYEDTGISKF